VYLTNYSIEENIKVVENGKRLVDDIESGKINEKFVSGAAAAVSRHSPTP